MKLKLLMLSLLMLPAAWTVAQKIDDHEVEFDYTRLPKKPVDKGNKNYCSEVILAYEAPIVASQAAAQAEYEQAVKDYPQACKDAEARHKLLMDRYDVDMAAWKEKSVASKIVEKELLNENNKPVPPPAYYPPAKPSLRVVEHEKIFSKEMLNSTYLKLDGGSRVPSGALKFTATLFGFDSGGRELKSSESSVYNSTTKATTKVMSYWYETPHKHPIKLTVQSATGEVLLDETFERFNQYTIAKTNTVQGSYPVMDPRTYDEGLQNKIVESNMKEINEYINDNYGYSKLKRKTAVNRVESKQLNYDDYQKAFEAASAGYNLLASNAAGAKAKINEAITIWEAAMKESNLGDKKARVNTEVTMATLFNLAEAYVWVDDYANAEARLNKIVGLSPSKKERKLLDDNLEFVKDQKVRHEANL